MTRRSVGKSGRITRARLPAHVALAALTGLVAAACGTGDDSAAPTTTTEPTTTTAADDDRPACEAAEYTVRYPPSWSVNETDDPDAAARTVGPCQFFDPETVDIAPGTEAEAAVIIRAEPSYEDLVANVGTGRETTDRAERQLDGHQAVRLEIEESGQGLHPAGTRQTMWLVDLRPLGLVASTSEANAEDYGAAVDVLDEMMASLDVAAEPRCTAGDLTADLPVQDLSEPVATTRRAIAEAAVACDYAALDELAPPDFSYSFGANPGDPSASWRAAELDGTPITRLLAGLLARPVGLVEASQPAIHVWPSAFAYDSWDAVPADERQALKPFYDEDDFARWSEFGGYVGYRAGIAADGTWRHFIAGD